VWKVVENLRQSINFFRLLIFFICIGFLYGADDRYLSLIGLDYHMSDFFDRKVDLIGFHAGFIVGDFSLGFSGACSIGEIHPAGYRNGKIVYGGIDIRFFPMRNSFIHIGGKCLLGIGYMNIDTIDNSGIGVYYDPSPIKFADENFYMLEPGILLALHLSETLRMGYGISYRGVFRKNMIFYRSSDVSKTNNSIIFEIIF